MGYTDEDAVDDKVEAGREVCTWSYIAREINGSRNREKPVPRTKDTLPAPPESRRAIRETRREKRRKNRIGSYETRERTKREG